MNRKPIIAAVVLAAAGLAAWLIISSRFAPAPTLSGYIEGESLYLAAPVAGAVDRVDVRRGQRVAAGAPLFVIRPDQAAAQAARSAADVAVAQAQAQDVRKGERPAELGVFEAELAAAEATMRAAQAELSRTRRLVERGVYARARLDDDSATFQAAQAQTRAAQRRLDAARQGARSDQILAADARVAEAKAGLTEASAKLSDLAPRAPAAARVEEVFLQPGEWAAANQPVVALIPDARVFVRFFAPERSAAAYRPGQIVTFTCDGCAKALKAKITFISPRPEFTPPVIYSRETRDRLVFMVEAAPENPQGLVPGLPVDVTPLKPASRP